MGAAQSWLWSLVIPNVLMWALGLTAARFGRWALTRWPGVVRPTATAPAALPRPTPVDIVVLTALELEYAAVRQHLGTTRVVRHPRGTLFESGEFVGDKTRIALAIAGPGNLDSAVLAERAIGFLHPRVLLFVGIAGALHNDLPLGHLVIATKVHAYQGGRLDGQSHHAAPTCWRPAHRLLERSRQLSRTDHWRGRVHFRPIAAGDVVVNNLNDPLVEYIRHHYCDSAAVEMESAGLAAAIALNDSLPALIVRGISDQANGGKDATDADGWPHYAAAQAAAFVAALSGALALREELTQDVR
jgi:adenosylhomocysteine nucleosidase